jgi:hypothetical protein
MARVTGLTVFVFAADFLNDWNPYAIANEDSWTLRR